jgi:hypothetical protein
MENEFNHLKIWIKELVKKEVEQMVANHLGYYLRQFEDYMIKIIKQETNTNIGKNESPKTFKFKPTKIDDIKS